MRIEFRIKKLDGKYFETFVFLLDENRNEICIGLGLDSDLQKSYSESVNSAKTKNKFFNTELQKEIEKL